MDYVEDKHKMVTAKPEANSVLLISSDQNLQNV